MKAYIKNLPGKHTRRKIVAFYVDDWGSVRIRDKQAFRFLSRKGVDMYKDPFTRYDTLAGTADLEALYETLSAVKDVNGNPACFTAVMNPCNPDFESIRANGCTAFVSEPFTQTLHKYGQEYENAFARWKEGMDNHLFYPVFHGTEHVSRRFLMEAFQAGHAPTRWGFDCESVGIPTVTGYPEVPYILRPYAIETPRDNEPLKENIRWGLDQFEQLFGFRARQFKAGGDIISPDLYPTLAQSGIEYMDDPLHIKRHIGNGTYKRFISYTGKRNRLGQKSMVRNALFEPAAQVNAVGPCMRLIDAAFKCRKPALISSHRVNFVGGLDEQNRTNGLRQLSDLLKAIVRQWPDVEFMNADQAGDIIYECTE